VALGQNQAEIAGGRFERRRDKALAQAVLVGALTAEQVPVALHQYAAAQHVGQRGDALAVLVGFPEGLGEAIADQKGKIGVFTAQGRIGVAVPVDGQDAVSVFRHNIAVGVHAERAHRVLVLAGAVMQLGLVDRVGDFLEDNRRQLDAHADIDLVVDQIELQTAALVGKPFGAGPPRGCDQVPAGHVAAACGQPEAVSPVRIDREHFGPAEQVEPFAQVVGLGRQDLAVAFRT